MRDSSLKLLSALHVRLYNMTGGRLGRRLVNNDMLLLTTTGARTGQPHTVPLLYLRDGEDLIVIASYGGRPDHPQWYKNLLSSPVVGLQIDGTELRARARTATPDERALIWPMVTEAYGGYGEYQARTDREIPVVILEVARTSDAEAEPGQFFRRRVVYHCPMPAVEVSQLVKEYGATTAVAGVDLAIETGEVFALLGPNGAGKTTAVEIMEGHRERTSGAVNVLGYDPESGGREFRERIGIVLQETAVEPELTVKEVLDVYGDVYPKRRPTGELIELVGLEEKMDARVKTLSGGQKRRLELALGLVGDPDLVFLDEPTTGFDPSARRQAWSIVENLAALGKTILLTTHYMDEAQHLANRIAVISAGRIVAEGTPNTLGGRQDAEATVRFSLPPGVSATDLPVQPTATVDGVVIVSHPSPTRLLHQLTSWAIEMGVELEGLSVERPTLEDIYLQLVGEGASV